MNSLEISLYHQSERLHHQIIEPMFGNYVFGRNYQTCKNFSHGVLLKPTTVINWEHPPNYLSSIHAVICHVDKEFHLIDGWGQNYSRNGVYVNGNKIVFKVLRPNDTIHLGTRALKIVFREPTKEDEKITENSQFF